MTRGTPATGHATDRAETSNGAKLRPAAVTVIVPTYNNRETLLRAIASVLAQTVPPREIIIVDDCSSDGFDAVRVRRLDARIRVIRHAQRRGGSCARNTGIDHASSEMIAFLDADDAWFPDKLERQMARLGRDARNVMLASNCRLGETAHAPVHNRQPPGRHESLAHFLLVSGGGLQTSTLIVPTTLARKVRFRPGLRRHQDWDFVLRLEAAGARLMYEQDALSMYDVSKRAGRVSRQDLAFVRTVEWFRLVGSLVPASYMQHYFVTQCLTRHALRHPVHLARSLWWIARVRPSGMPRLLRPVTRMLIRKLTMQRA